MKCFVSVTGLIFTYQHSYLGLLLLLVEENVEKSSHELVYQWGDSPFYLLSQEGGTFSCQSDTEVMASFACSLFRKVESHLQSGLLLMHRAQALVLVLPAVPIYSTNIYRASSRS